MTLVPLPVEPPKPAQIALPVPPVQPQATLPLVNGRDLVYQGKLPEPLVEGILLPKSLNLLSAESYTGKTFFLMELARSVATGTLFMGKYKTKPGAVLFIASDGSHWSYALQWKKIAGENNLREQKALQGVEDEDLMGRLRREMFQANALADRVMFSVLSGVQLTQAGVDQISRAANGIEHSFGEYATGEKEVAAEGSEEDPALLGPDITEPSTLQGVSLILIDTFRATFDGNENDNGLVQDAMNRLRWLIDKTGAAVVFTHHLSKPSRDSYGPGTHRVRGASSLIGAIDGHIQLHRGPAARGEVTINAYHLKDRAGTDEPGFKYRMDYDNDSITFEWLGPLKEDKAHKAGKKDEVSGDKRAILLALEGGSKTNAELVPVLPAGPDPANPRRLDSLQRQVTRCLKALALDKKVEETGTGQWRLLAAAETPDGA